MLKYKSGLQTVSTGESVDNGMGVFTALCGGVHMYQLTGGRGVCVATFTPVTSKIGVYLV